MSDALTETNRPGMPRLLIAFIGAAVLFDHWLAWGGPIFVLLPETMWIGNILGQASFAAMFTGLSGRTWIAGWLRTYLLVVVVVASIYLALSLQNRLPQNQWSIVAIFPLIALGGVAPLVAARSFWGWSLVRSQHIELPRPEHRVEDLFFFSIITACAVTVANMFAPPGTNPLASLGGTLMCTIYSLLLIVPVTAVTFRARNWSQRLLGYAAITCIAVATLELIIWVTITLPSNLMIQVLLFAPLLSMSWLAGNAALLASGYRLTKYAPRPQVAHSTDANPFELTEDSSVGSVTVGQAARHQARQLTAAVAAVAMLAVVGTFVRDRLLIAKFRQLENPSAYFGAAVDTVDYDGNEVASVVMSPKAMAEDILKVAKRAPNIMRLSLAGTKFDDKSVKLLDAFPALEHLDLSGTLITDQGLKGLRSLRSLSLADTRVTFAEAIYFAQQHSLGVLDLSGTGISDDKIDAVNDIAINLTTLKLARNPISDKGVSDLFAKQVTTYELDLSDTQVDGQCLAAQACPGKVNLDGTQVTDAILGKLLALPTVVNCQQMSLRRTKITAAILPALDGRSIRLGEGLITEADLLSLPPAPTLRFNQLGLNGPEFTGESLTKRIFHADAVDLSGSSVTDEVLQRYNEVNWLGQLRLCHTRVTPAGLQKLNAREIDLRYTQIKGAELRKMQLEYRNRRILMRHENCRAEDLVPLRKKAVSFDEKGDWPEW